MYLSADWIVDYEPNMGVFVFLFHLLNMNKTHPEMGGKLGLNLKIDSFDRHQEAVHRMKKSHSKLLSPRIHSGNTFSLRISFPFSLCSNLFFLFLFLVFFFFCWRPLMSERNLWKRGFFKKWRCFDFCYNRCQRIEITECFYIHSVKTLNPLTVAGCGSESSLEKHI